MPKDNFLLGSAYRKAGILTAYDPARLQDAEDDDRGLGAWQDRKNWYTVSHIFALFFWVTQYFVSYTFFPNQAEWEERREKRLVALTALGGVSLASKPSIDALALED